MKKFDIFAMVVFTITSLACGVAGFYNSIHWLFSALSALVVVLSYLEYKNEKELYS